MPPHTKIPILDNGYISLIETWGSDERIIEAARTSTDKDTPFEFGGLVIEVQAPIFVFREWHRHRTQSFNEMSARYVQMPNLHYLPSTQRILESSVKSANKQSNGGGVLDVPVKYGPPADQEEAARIIQDKIRIEQGDIYNTYETLIRYGVSKEIARINTPVSRYSRMRASTCLRNWISFLTLRKDRNAQWEIRQYADAIGNVLKDRFPRTWELFSLNHPGSWDDDGLPFYDHQIAMLEKKLAAMKVKRAALPT